MSIAEPAKAHQRCIREAIAERASDDLFGDWWPKNTKASDCTVRPVSYETAKRVIEEYEWLGSMPHICLHSFGAFYEGACAGVVTYSPEYCENLGRWDRFGFTGKIILLSRGACVHWAHPHTGSMLIRRSMKMLPEKYRVITAMVDRRAGEIGTIYQSCGFDYVGAMRAESGLAPRQPNVVIDGKIVAHRTAKQRFGTASAKKISEILGYKVETTPDIDKERYFGFRGSPSEVRRYRRAISSMVRPYPKRDYAACPVDERFPDRVSVAQPHEAAP